VIIRGDGEWLGERFAAGRAAAINRDAFALLEACRGGLTAAEAATLLAENGYQVTVEEAGAALEEMAAAGILCRSSEAEGAMADRIVADDTWDAWGAVAQYFHFATKDAASVSPAQEPDGTEQADDHVVRSRPALFKRYPGRPRMLLPRPALPPPVPFHQVLLGRRTVRDFTDDKVVAQQLADVLHYATAPQHLVDAGNFGALPKRAYANGGARSELEVYASVRGVDGLDDGLFHYEPITHCLEHLAPALDAQRLMELSYGQPMCPGAPVNLFVTAVVGRAGSKYRHPRALRIVYMDAGHLAQAFAMTATSYGLGAFQTAAFQDSEIERALGVDGVSETVLYWLGMGVPAPGAGPELTRPAGLAPAALTMLFDDIE
jgi:SagB-type dehydrogenase family enzyme